MVVAVFYLTGVQDACVCFYSVIDIFEWESHDESLNENLKSSTNRSFAFVVWRKI